VYESELSAEMLSTCTLWRSVLLVDESGLLVEISSLSLQVFVSSIVNNKNKMELDIGGIIA
jgi:hypothetical protein